MDAKDTVMKETPQISMSFATLLSEYRVFNEFQNTIKNDRHTQAEISFKAGVKSGYSAGNIDGQSTNHKRHSMEMKQARQAGIKEVVEWLNNNFEPTVPMSLDYRKWQAKLKDWNIKWKSITAK